MSGFSPELGVGFSVLVNVNTAFGHANIDGFIRGIANIILGTMPRSAKPSMIEKMALWFVYILPLVICLLAFNYIKQYRLGKKNRFKASLPTKRNSFSIGVSFDSTFEY